MLLHQFLTHTEVMIFEYLPLFLPASTSAATQIAKLIPQKDLRNIRICKFSRTPLRGGLPALIELTLHPVLSRIFCAFPGHMLHVRNRPTEQVSSKELVSPIYAPSIRSDRCRPNQRGQKETAANWTSQFEPPSQSQLLS